MVGLMGLILPLAVLALALLASCAPARPLHGTTFSPPQTARRFALIDQTGTPYVLAQKRDTFTALYFGFTHCKDVCPQTLAMLGKSRARAGIAPAQLPIVMVSVDPTRDTPRALRAFFAKAGVQAIGLTGTTSQLRPVYRAYGVAVRPEKHDIGHTDYIYVLDKDGRLRELLSPQTPIDAIAEDLRTIVE